MHSRTGLIAIILSLLLASPLVAQNNPLKGPHRERKKEVDQLGRQNDLDAMKKLVHTEHKATGVPYLIDPHNYVKDTTFKRLTQFTDRDAIAFLWEKAIFDKRAELRARVLEALGELGNLARGAGPNIVKLLERVRDEDTIVEGIRTLGILEFDGGLELIEKFADGRRVPWRIRGEALEALYRIAPDKAVSHLEKGLEAKDWRVRIPALRYLGRAAPASGIEAARAVIREEADSRPGRIDRYRRWQNVLTALKLFRHLENRTDHTAALKKAVGDIISLFKNQTGRMRLEVARCLEDLTGETDLAEDFESWNYWWKMNRESWTPQARGEVSEGGGEKQRSTRVRFHGVPIHSNRVVFCLDLSGSMDEEITYREEEVARDPGERGGTRSRDRDRETGGKTVTKIRLELSKEELIRTVQSFASDVLFNVVFFGTKVSVWEEDDMLQATPRNKRRAIRYVRKRQVEGRTNIHDALRKAMEYPLCDTIYLLSDGGPSEGAFIRKDRVLKRLSYYLKYYQPRITTILFGESEVDNKYNKWFMQELAEQTGGRYVPKY